ncbi:hypothetical protein ABGN05_14005 [Aquibium sp. LZ166]|uniref:Uncharacterized protein n=1 Tax=Aquibium pacificus TaxID=3153579 RepID=A0ABV3SKD2_9HYPH
MLTHQRLIATGLLGGLLANVLAISPALAEQKTGSGPTNEEIYCQNRAVNDYYDNVKACEANLSDLADQLALCKSDARADLDRAKASCMAARSSPLAKLPRAPLGRNLSRQ